MGGRDGPTTTRGPEAGARAWTGLALQGIAFAGVYGLLMGVGRSSIPGGYYNVFRPAAGFLLAVLMVAPIRQWPAIVAIATAVDAALARRFPGLLPIAQVLPLVNSLSVVLNAALMRRIFRQRRNLLDLRELAFFLAATAVGSVAFAGIAGAIFEAFQPGLPVGDFAAWQRWQVWTTGNILGVIVVTPVAMTLLKQPGYRSPLDPMHTVGRWTELLLLLAAVGGLTVAIFRDDLIAAFSMREVTYVLVPLFTWLVLRFDPRVSLSAWMGVAMISAWSTQNGEGPFARAGATPHEHVMAAQVFLLVPTLSLLALGGVLNDRRVKEEELARSEQRYRAVVEDQTELIVRALPDGVVTFVNGAVCRALGASADALIGRAWPGLLTAREGPEGGAPDGLPTVTREGRVPVAGGGDAWYQWTDRTLVDRRGNIVAHQSVGRDITALKASQEDLRRANARLQSMSRRLVGAQEEERRAVARELHDEVGQTLTALKIDLLRLRRFLTSIEADGEALARLDDATATAGRAMEEVRSLSQDLRPSVLDDFGLVAALRWCVERQAERAGFAGAFEAGPGALSASPTVETTCYRIVQEALTNAVRHAGASRVDVRLGAEGGRLVLEVADDGAGFDVAEATARASRGGSLGLINMAERAELAGGELTIDSAPRRGTRVVARFPLAAGAPATETTGAAAS